MRESDFHIAGGGIIGLAVAFRLAQGGARVTVFDSGKPGQATQAAAGMLAPLAESAAGASIEPMGVPSLRRYPAFLDDIAAAGGVRVPLNGPGIMRLAHSAEEAEALLAAVERNRTTGLPMCLIDPAELRRMEPEIGVPVVLASHSPAEQHVTPPDLLATLKTACNAMGVEILTGEILGFATHNGHIQGICTDNGMISCDRVIVAGGVWSRELLEPLGILIPIMPVKGQVVHLHPAKPPLRHTLFGHGLYLVPRPNGDLLVGATEEPEKGFDAQPTEPEIAGLISGATILVPTLRGAVRAHTRVGLRPVTPDKLPLIGMAPGYDNLILAAGHGRNGILMTPITADIVADFALKGIPPPSLVSPDRFGGIRQ